MSAYKIWECQICNWVYDEAKGCPEEGLAPGTRWEDIPDDWCCPECGVGKDEFEMLEISATEPVSEPPTSKKTDVTKENAYEADSPSVRASVNPIVIIGSGLAGYNLAKEIRRLDPDCPITLITADDGSYYSKPQLSTGFSSGKRAADLVLNDAESMAKQYKLDVHIHSRVTRIDAQVKAVELEHGAAIKYSCLVMATGATCNRIPVSGNAAGHVLQINDLQDYAKFRTRVKNNSRVLVIGAGLIGSEYADDLTRAGHQVTLVDPMDGALAALLPGAASRVLTQNLKNAGIYFHLSTSVERIDNQGHGLIATLGSGARIETDLVLMATGIRPNTRLAQQAGLTVNRGIRVDKHMQTSVEDIYAIGDCAEVGGQVLPYVAPLNAQAKALAKTLTGEVTSVDYGVMPVLVKTQLHPVMVSPPISDKGRWTIDVDAPTGVKARFTDSDGNLLGYALTGDQCKQGQQLMQQCAPLSQA